MKVENQWGMKAYLWFADFNGFFRHFCFFFFIPFLTILLEYASAIVCMWLQMTEIYQKINNVAEIHEC